MKKLCSWPWFWVILAAVSLVIHALWAWRTHDGIQAERCGATWVIFAVAITARPIIRMGYLGWYQSAKTIDAGSFGSTPEQDEEKRQSKVDADCVQLWGPGLAVLGTFLWAYGDLVANGLCSLVR